MEVLRYNRGNLVVMALVSGIAAVFFVMLFISPEAASETRKGRMLADGVGHFLFVPLLILICAAVSWRATMLSLGNTLPIEARDHELLVSKFWGVKRVKLSELVSVSVVRVSSGWFTQNRCLKSSGAVGKRPVR